MNEERWFWIDLHIHTPASTDYQEGEPSLLEILRKARDQSLHIVGLVDHNTVRGYEQLRLELSRLTVLQEAGLLSSEEKAAWQEYQELLHDLLVLPGFELTCQEGIHLLALFSPETSAERLYALLLNLGIPMERLREGSPAIHAQANLQTACTMVAQAGGIAIAAHINTPQGLKPSDCQSLPQGLLALEVDALPEETPAMPLPLVWFSNAHSQQGHRHETHPWGIGEQYTEMLLEDQSFEALHKLLRQGNQERLRFPEQSRLRTHLERMRQEGAEHLILHSPDVDPTHVYHDIVALANAGGGMIMIGLTDNEVTGITDPESWSATLLRDAREKVDPPPHLNLELLRYEGKEIIRVEVRTESTPPYLSVEGVVYVRRGNQTRPAQRQELLELIATDQPANPQLSAGLELPQAGVEIVGAHLRDGVRFYDVRDLRVTSGVTRQRAKGLWAYAIERHEALRQGRTDFSKVSWKGSRGVWRAYYSGERRVYDLLHRDSAGRVDHIFYGVSEWGLISGWRELVETNRIDPGYEPAPSQREHHESRKEQPTARPEPAPRAEVEDASGNPDGPMPTPASVTTVTTPPPDVPAPEQTNETPMPAPPLQQAPIRPSLDAWGGRLPRWRNQAAVERIYWEGNKLFFDLAMRQEDNQTRYFRRVHRNQLAVADGWVDLIRVSRPATGVEVVRSTTSGDEILYQFRDMETGRIDPRVRRASEFPAGSPYAYAIQMFHQDRPLDETQVRWWGNIGYMRPNEKRVDLVYRDEEGRDLIYYAAERHLLVGEWEELLRVWHKET